MKRVGLLLIALACASSAFAGAPNPGSLQPGETIVVLRGDVDLASDSRLGQLVTYEARGVRLHTVLSEISRKTGVTIACGRSADDWQVRDLPVTVCVKDLPLGALMRTLTDCTHLYLSASMVDDVPVYRIWLDKKHRDKMTEYKEDRSKAARAAAEYDWDLWKSLKDVPNIDSLRVNPEFFEIVTGREVEAISSIIASLDQKTKDRIMDHDLWLVLSEAPEPMKHDLRTTFAEMWGSQLSEEEMERSFCLRIGFGQYRGPDPTGLTVEVSKQRSPGGAGDGVYRYYETGPLIKWLTEQGNDVPARPVIPDPPGNDDLDARYTNLEPYITADDARPILDTKIKLVYNHKELDATGKPLRPTVLDVLFAAARALGYSAVAESSCINTPRDQQSIPMMGFRDEQTMRTVTAVCAGWVWYADRKNKVLICCGRNWQEQHRNLVSERTLASFKAKLDTTGFDLDDVQPLIDLTRGQIRAWIGPDVDLNPLDRCATSLHTQPGWQLYFALSRQDRIKARTKEGASLDVLDPTFVQSVLRERAYSLDGLALVNGKLRTHYLTDGFCNPTGITGMKLSIVENERERRHYVRLEGTRHGKLLTGQHDFLERLPIYSPKRAAELAGGK